MIGDQADMQQRIRSVLPARWFPDDAPVLDGLLSALSWAWAWLYSVLGYVRAQTRIATASDVWLDMIAFDYFGASIVRGALETDDSLRARISIELTRERGTRAAVAAAVDDLTGFEPAIFEPSFTADTGGWGGAGTYATGFAFGAAGGWGSLALPFQFFVTVRRPAGAGVTDAGGWGSGAGGYGAGAIEWVAEASIQSGVTDASIYAAVAGVLPAATVAWTNITDANIEDGGQ
jgi:hypothetical protein